MKDRVFSLALLLPFVLSPMPCKGVSGHSDELQGLTVLEATIRRHFAGIGGFKRGDLIARSQVEELQEYLRRTRGHSVAIPPRIRVRVLPDASRLVRLFYSEQGAEILRIAAEKLEGYERLDRLSRTLAGRARLRAAIKANTADSLVELLSEQSEPAQEAKRLKKAGEKSPPKLSRIYTVDELVAAMLASAEAKPLATSQKENALKREN